MPDKKAVQPSSSSTAKYRKIIVILLTVYKFYRLHGVKRINSLTTIPVTNQENRENAVSTCVMVTERSKERAPKAKDLQKQKSRDQGQAQAGRALGEGATRDSSSFARPLLSLCDLS